MRNIFPKADSPEANHGMLELGMYRKFEISLDTYKQANDVSPRNLHDFRGHWLIPTFATHSSQICRSVPPSVRVHAIRSTILSQRILLGDSQTLSDTAIKQIRLISLVITLATSIISGSASRRAEKI